MKFQIDKQCLLSLLPRVLAAPAFAVATTIALADQAKLEPHSAQSDRNWVVVLDDPRPERLQGWRSERYGMNSAHYSDSPVLKRLGKQFSEQFGLKLLAQWYIESLSVYCLVVDPDNNQSKTLEQRLKQLQKDSRVKWVQPSNNFYSLSTIDSAEKKVVTVDKDRLGKSLPVGLDGQGVHIALIDSAVDYQHRNLRMAIKEHRDFVIGSGPKRTHDKLRGELHGTGVAGILAARPNSRLGIKGVAPAAKISAFRGCWQQQDKTTRCNTLSLARALDATTKIKPDIVNLSLSGPKDKLLDEIAIRIVERGATVVTAFDPARAQNDRFPGIQQGLLIVRAEMSEERPSQSKLPGGLEHRNIVTAPGEHILTTSPNNSYALMSGHSVATAQTSGILALYSQSLKSTSVNANKGLADSIGLESLRTQQQLIELLSQTHF